MPRKTLKQLAGNSNQQKMKKYKIDEDAKESRLDKNYFFRSDGLVNEYDYFYLNNN
jgi:capsular polysaccharide biosynthesis protein